MDAYRSGKGRVEIRMTVEEAAHSLGAKEESVRKRVRGKKMHSEKDEDGRLYVYVESSEHPDAVRSADESRDISRELIESKDETIRILQVQLQKERETGRQADRIIAQLTQANAVLAQWVTDLEASRTREEASQGTAAGAARRAAGRYGRASWLSAAPGHRRLSCARIAAPPMVEESFRRLGCRSTVARV